MSDAQTKTRIDEIKASIEAVDEEMARLAKTGGGSRQYQPLASRRRMLESELRELEAETLPVIYVVGNTYPHRRELRDLGLKWHRGYHAWVGRANPDNLPAGCRAVSESEASLASMEHEGSMF